MPPTLALIGLRGSGKTTLGERLARRLGRPFIDLDDRTPGVLGETDVASAWAKHGEPAFRRAELQALRDSLTGPQWEQDMILALGGGTPTAPGAADLLRQHRAQGALTIVYLRAQPATLRRRLAGAKNDHRPSLTGRPITDEIELVHAARDPLYLTLADLVIDIDGLKKAQVIDLLARAAGEP